MRSDDLKNEPAAPVVFGGGKNLLLLGCFRSHLSLPFDFNRTVVNLLFRNSVAFVCIVHHSTSKKQAGSTIRQKMTDIIQKQSLAEIHYISIADIETLDELDVVKPPALVSLAVKIGKTRLIDNVVVG